LKNFARRDRRIRVLSQPANRGIHFVRCLGAREARGEYILSLDSDDVLELDIVEIAHGAAKRLAVDILEFREYIYEKGFRSTYTLREGLDWEVVCWNPFRTILGRDLSLGHLHWRLVRRHTYLAALEILGTDSPNLPICLYEDTLHVMALAKAAQTLAKIDKIGYHYHRREGSLSLPDRGTMMDPTRIRRIVRGQVLAIREILRLLPPNLRGKSRIFTFIGSHLLPSLKHLATVLSAAEFRNFLAPMLEPDYFSCGFSLASIGSGEFSGPFSGGC
jgi:glycosyltransferase involved in cell wall biosynthesis